ncbi:putative DNA binding domain-containing protein [Telmatocola sphagniphila]|uniref:Putative DNA binding domain-containing protein n=1 Tax=Telmatocola sphagniphila TaxID=1123043 RepID=A0A8E6B4E6_9BACT|nr:ATP-binding protein [Telmatocola sphagniphila]QVL30921.1 putative DNA binding domain-containing protein [Telmatocola sphagniphila]
MNPTQLSALLVELLSLPAETEWVEWKHNNDHPEMIAERISALANSAALHGRDFGYMVWGVENGSKKVVGTTFRPRQSKKGNEELENWLMRSQHPQVNFQIHEWSHQGVPMVLFQIPRASQAPVRFGSEEFVRIGSLTKKLREYTEKERELWAIFARKPFETGIAKLDVDGPDVLTLLDFDRCFKLLQIPLPTDQQGILGKLVDERLIVPKPGGRFDITNLGAILFATDLNKFERLGRKALRIIKYRGDGRTDMEREWRDAPTQMGYAVAFEAAVAFINSQLPQNEPIGQAFREEVRVYPEKAIRELVANGLIHQEFSVTGAGPMVEIFDSRMEITNPGEPLVDTLRFIDTPPKSRNETLAAVMRRMKICEEAGTGIDKVVAAIEAFQLPAPDFTAITTSQPGFTKATLYAPRRLNDMDSKERIRACYQHACLCLVSGSRMTNTTLRERLGVEPQNYAIVSRIIRDTINANLVKAYDPNTSKRFMQYLPFWA